MAPPAPQAVDQRGDGLGRAGRVNGMARRLGAEGVERDDPAADGRGRPLRTRGVSVGEEDRVPGAGGDEGRERPDGAAADNDNRRARRQVQAGDGVEGDGERLRHREVARRDALRCGEDIRGRQQRQFGKAAVDHLADEAEALADLAEAGAAGGAGTADDPAVHRDRIADGDVLHARPDRGDDARELVAGDGGRAGDPLAGGIVVQVRPADAGRRHPDDDLAGAGRGRGRHVLHPQVAHAVKSDRTHQVSPSDTPGASGRRRSRARKSPRRPRASGRPAPVRDRPSR